MKTVEEMRQEERDRYRIWRDLIGHHTNLTIEMLDDKED